MGSAEVPINLCWAGNLTRASWQSQLAQEAAEAKTVHLICPNRYTSLWFTDVIHTSDPDEPPHQVDDYTPALPHKGEEAKGERWLKNAQDLLAKGQQHCLHQGKHIAILAQSFIGMTSPD